MEDKVTKKQLLLQINALTLLANSQFGNTTTDKIPINVGINNKIFNLRKKYNTLL